MAFRDVLYYAAGLIFLFLAKLKHVLEGYSSPKPFGTSQVSRCVKYDIGVVNGWVSHLSRYLGVSRDECLAGKDVLELGPGSDLGVGACLLSRGAASYNACDVNSLASQAPDAVYEELFSQLRGADRSADVEALREEIQKCRGGYPRV